MTHSLLQKPDVTPFFDAYTNTFSYVVKAPSSNSCAVIDSVLDFDYASGSTSYVGADAIIAFVREQQLQVEWLIETHAHADHLSRSEERRVGKEVRSLE